MTFLETTLSMLNQALSGKSQCVEIEYGWTIVSHFLGKSIVSLQGSNREEEGLRDFQNYDKLNWEDDDYVRSLSYISK